jgi:predicted porin
MQRKTPIFRLCHSGTYVRLVQYIQLPENGGWFWWKTRAPIQTLENLEMKKTLVALAALAATSAFAQSSVTVYGLVDIAYGAKTISKPDGSMVAKQSGIMDGGYAGNRIGFKGTEDIGSGQVIGFVYEQGFSPTAQAPLSVRTGTAGIQYEGYAASTGKFDLGTAGGYTQGNNRQTFLSAKDNGLGEIRAGYQYTTLYEISTLSGFTQTSEGVFGGSQAHVHGQAIAGGTRANGITYISPRIQGFEGSVQVGSTTGRENTEFSAGNTANGKTQDRNKRMSFKLDYDQGPLKVAYGHTSFYTFQSPVVANGTLPTPAATVAPGSTATQVNVFNIYGALTAVGTAATDPSQYNTTLNQYAARYKVNDNLVVGGTVNKGTYNVTWQATPTAGGGTAPSAGKYTSVGAYDFSSQRISALYTMGKVSFMAGTSTATVDANSVRYMDLKENQLGAFYDFSKRSKAYIYMGNWTDSAAQATTNYKGKATVAGLVHTF